MSKEKVIHVAVVGVSGLEGSKGRSVGVGKSALCNRFVRPLADDYLPDDHITVVSQYDFKGHVINNDQFLYWGDVTKPTDSGYDIHFSVIEQTEFLDDRSYAPLEGSNTLPYAKRCATTKLKSNEKLMYIKSYHQIGDEDGYERKVLPDGKFIVDGYIMVFDVKKTSQGRPVDNQVEFLEKLYKAIAKTKRPIVVVATKCDESDGNFLKAAQDFAVKIKRNYVETSSHKALNVDLAFITLAQLIDKSLGVPQSVMYSDAFRYRKEFLDRVEAAYTELLEKDVVNYQTLWAIKSKEYQKTSQPFIAYSKHMGAASARRVFEKHRQKLKMELIEKKQEQYLGTLLKVLEEVFPDHAYLMEMGQSWTECKDILIGHPNFQNWFAVLHEEWKQSPYLTSKERKIPYDFLSTNNDDCEKVFNEYVDKLGAAAEDLEGAAGEDIEGENGKEGDNDL